MAGLARELFRVLDEPYPCQGCEHAGRCRKDDLACRSFEIYLIRQGELDLTRREPSRVVFNRVFAEVEPRCGRPPKVFDLSKGVMG